MKSHEESINSIDISNDGKRLISAGNDIIIKEWDITTGRCIKKYRGHTKRVNTAIYLQKASQILSAGEDKTVKQWDTSSGKCVKNYKNYGDIKALATNDINFIAGGEGGFIYEYKIKVKKELRYFSGNYTNIKCICYRPDGLKFIASGESRWDYYYEKYTDNEITEWDVKTGNSTTYPFYIPENIKAMAYSNDGNRILIESSEYIFYEINLINLNYTRTFKGHRGSITSLNYNNDEKKILSASEDGTIKEWDYETGVCLKTIEVEGVKKSLYSHDGFKIFSAGKDGIIREFDTETSNCCKTFC